MYRSFWDAVSWNLRRMMSGQAGAQHNKNHPFFIVVNSCGAANISKASAASRGWASGVVTFKKMAETLARANFFKKLRLWVDLGVFLKVRGGCMLGACLVPAGLVDSPLSAARSRVIWPAVFADSRDEFRKPICGSVRPPSGV